MRTLTPWICIVLFLFLRKKKQLLLMVLVCIILSKDTVAQKVYVYYPTDIKPIAIQNQFSENCPGITITALGRYKDFSTMLAQDPPDAIITITYLAKQLPDYTIALNGVRKGKTKESYVILSINDSVTIDQLGPESIVGILDFLGRAEMAAFISELTAKKLKLKRVTKVDDLFPLLSFNMVQAVICTENNSDYIKQISHLKLISVPIPGKTFGIVSVATNKNTNSALIVEMIKKTKSVIGIDTWE